jgi:glycosyltransferase involved in cell wall biosynthesis
MIARPMPSVCIIVPCYNEANRLPVDTFLDYARQHPSVQFCLVDDGSSDTTRTILEGMQTILPAQIVALILSQNQGKAGAVRAGMLHMIRTELQQANRLPDYLGFFDADLATPLDAIGDLTTVLDKRPELDMVLGSRIKHLGSDIQRKVFRHYSGRFIATLISNILDLPVYDSQCGAKLFRRPCVSYLFSQSFISPWLFDVELLARLIQRYGHTEVLGHVAEFPLRQWTEKSDSRIQPSYYIKLWYELYRIYRHYRTV